MSRVSKSSLQMTGGYYDVKEIVPVLNKSIRKLCKCKLTNVQMAELFVMYIAVRPSYVRVSAIKNTYSVKLESKSTYSKIDEDDLVWHLLSLDYDELEDELEEMSKRDVNRLLSGLITHTKNLTITKHEKQGTVKSLLSMSKRLLEIFDRI